jgi:starch-binding outer membrane protein, SusD/RagB family
MNIRESVKNQVLGEAYFARGHAYFWLAPRYGDHRAGIPIVTVENMEDIPL